MNSLTVAGIEKNMLAGKQRVCPELRAIYLGKLAEAQGEDPRKALLAAEKDDPKHFRAKRIDALVRSLDKFEMVNTVLFRREYNIVSGEVELRCAAPTGDAVVFDHPGHGMSPLSYRSTIILDYHNGKIGGHQGRKRTVDMISRDLVGRHV